VDHPREVVKMGEELDVYVLKIDRERERISLSRKKLRPNPWSTVDEKYAVGDLVEGRIIRIVDYGAFVEVEPGVEGLLHTSQIARSNVESPHDVLQEDETHLLRIISINSDRQRMGLSLKAVTATEQIEWMTQREQDAAVEEVEEMDEQPAVDEAGVESEEAGEAEVPESTVEESEAVASEATFEESEALPQAAEVADEVVATETSDFTVEENAVTPAADNEVEPAA
jgi:ribosomal protein S1